MTIPEHPRLADFQAALLELLDAPLSVDEILGRLRTDEVFGPYRDYIDSFEPRMVEVAVELTKKWGDRSTSGRAEEAD